MTTNRKWKNALFNLAMTALIAFTIWAFVVSSPTKARPSYAKDLPSSLKNYCIVCHTAASGGPLNVFGDDYLSMDLNINATANLDSDGDGFTNEEELAAGTFPGNPDSYPGSPSAGANMPILEMIVLVAALLSIVLALFFYRCKMKEKHVGADFTKH